MSTVFIDSDVILYLLSGDTAKADRAEAMLNKGGIISVQVLNEVTSVCQRKLKMSWEEIDAVLLAVKAACDVVPLTVESHDKAVQIAKRYQLSFYDAHICAAAILAGAKTLLSEDMQSGMKIDSLVVKNPFA
ncbi:MAG: PIN domain-containing protein [Sideroxydans sp.]|nr:PIN domain-containing protein [Sideroxydans sp.]MDD5058822.1 PIN domain-containing protein [Sideroxydans sp.]